MNSRVDSEGTAGDEDEPARDVRPLLRNSLVDLRAVHVGQRKITQHQIEIGIVREAHERAPSRVLDHHLVLDAEQQTDRPAEQRLVVDDQDRARWPRPSRDLRAIPRL